VPRERGVLTRDSLNSLFSIYSEFPKLDVAGSIPVSRSKVPITWKIEGPLLRETGSPTLRNHYPSRFSSDFKFRFLISRCRYLGWIPSSLAASTWFPFALSIALITSCFLV